MDARARVCACVCVCVCVSQIIDTERKRLRQALEARAAELAALGADLAHARAAARSGGARSRSSPSRSRKPSGSAARGPNHTSPISTAQRQFNSAGAVPPPLFRTDDTPTQAPVPSPPLRVTSSATNAVDSQFDASNGMHQDPKASKRNPATWSRAHKALEDSVGMQRDTRSPDAQRRESSASLPMRSTSPVRVPKEVRIGVRGVRLCC